MYDFGIVGGGIVGLATALSLIELRPGARLVLIEKENRLAAHQTGHNSGVIHAGIYYQPGSLKAELCRKGAAATKEFCAAHGIRHEVCGKLIVATDDAELARMKALVGRASDNRIDIDVLDAAELRRLEPAITGKGAILVPSTGIADYPAICRVMGELVEKAGGEIVLGEAVTAIRETGDAVAIETSARRISARRLVCCGGLQSDRLARMAGLATDFRIVPFRGEYYRLPAHRNDVVRHLIYPVPDPALPFLGIHLTRMVDGGVTVGPNAVLGFAREGYGKGSLDIADALATFGHRGFWRLAAAHWRSGIVEMGNSLSRRRYLEACRKYCPDLTLADLQPEEAGIRAQAVTSDGTMVHDFLFAETARMLHVCNAPSPAATSALPIGRMIAERSLARNEP
ncbi:MAG: L-2-hydroxyglutarate oxidase [Hyphomicrobiaceae bacterium]